MTDLVIIALVALMLGAAIRYIYRRKKSGAHCIGCPHADGCGGNCGCGKT